MIESPGSLYILNRIWHGKILGSVSFILGKVLVLWHPAPNPWEKGSGDTVRV